MLSEEDKLRRKKAKYEKQIADKRQARSATALRGQRDPSVEKERSNQLIEIERLLVQLNDVNDALRQLAIEHSEAARQASEKARQRKIKEAVKSAKALLKTGDRMAEGFEMVAASHEEFQSLRMQVAQQLREAGLGHMANMMTRELRGQTLKFIMVATSPSTARLIGVPPFANGGKRKSFGLIDTIRKSDLSTWSDQPTDDPTFQTKKEGTR